MSHSSIYILSGPVRSGKTTLLQQWLSQGISAGGILTPDVAGKRKLYAVAAQTYADLETENTDRETMQVGRFVFDATVFDATRRLLEKEAQEDPSWLIVDELGKLELHRNEGLEPALGALIRRYKEDKQIGRLLLVIRDSLLDEAVRHYGLQNAAVITRAEQLMPLR